MAFKIARPLLTIPGSHLHSVMTERIPLQSCPLPEQVEHYLSRIRHTLPFPCSSAECYFGCLPEVIQKMDKHEVFDHYAPGATGNMVLTMNQSVSTGGSILHISVESEDEYAAAMKGLRGHERVFWTVVSKQWPVPRNSMQMPFFLPLEHPFRAGIMDWVGKAYAIEREIEQSLELTEKLESIVKTPAVAAKVWPELINFIHFKKGASNNVNKSMRDRAARALRPTDREELLSQLARAVMLPERPPHLLAWVGFYTKEIAT